MLFFLFLHKTLSENNKVKKKYGPFAKPLINIILVKQLFLFIFLNN